MADSRRALARAISKVERNHADAAAIVRTARKEAGRAQIVGITGPPGAGKSTLVTALAKYWRAQNQTVAVLSVDPSSPHSGGAILGDRIRMRALSGDPGVFIRSMASRGMHGGIASATSDIALLLDAHGFDRVLIETVGAGQSEVEIAQLAHTVLLVEAPGMGDDIQAIKAGILEIADVIVVNKADRPDADQTVNAIRAALDLATPAIAGHHGHAETAPVAQHTIDTGWQVPVIKAAALLDSGIAEICNAIDAHAAWLRTSGELHRRIEQRDRENILTQLRAQLLQRALAALDPAKFDALVQHVGCGELTAAEAAQRIADH